MQREQHESPEMNSGKFEHGNVEHGNMGSLGNGTSGLLETAQENVSSKELQDTVLAGVQLLKEFYTVIRSLNTKSKEDWFYKHDISLRLLLLMWKSYGISRYSIINQYFLLKEFTQLLSKITIPGIGAIFYDLASHTVCILQGNLRASQSKAATHGTESQQG